MEHGMQMVVPYDSHRTPRGRPIYTHIRKVAVCAHLGEGEGQRAKP